MSNSYILSNSMSPSLNAIQTKSSAAADLSYKMMKSIGSNVSKQCREIAIAAAYGANVSADLLKYGLVYNVYLKLNVTMNGGGQGDDAAKALLSKSQEGAFVNLLRSVVLSSHSRVLERLDRMQIINYILERATSDNAAILGYTHFNPTGPFTGNTSFDVLIPLPFSFFSMSRNKDSNHLQNLNISLDFASNAQAAKNFTTAQDVPAQLTGAQTAARVTINSGHLVMNYYEMDQASTKKMFEQNYQSPSGLVNQLYTTIYREATHAATVAPNQLVNVNVNINTKNVIVRSFIAVRHKDAAENAFIPVDKIAVNLNGIEYYAKSTDEIAFEKILTSDHYNRMIKAATNSADYLELYVFDFRLVNIDAATKFTGGLSAKNVSNPEYVLTLNSTSANIEVEVVHEVLNIVQISKADGSMQSVLSV